MIRITKNERAEALYRKYQKLAQSVAVRISRKSGVAYSELEGEALSYLGQLVFEDWNDSFDPTRSSACTWIYQKVYFRLKNFVLARGRRHLREGKALLDDDPRARLPHQSRLEGLLSEVGDEGWMLLRIIMEAPGDLLWALNPAAPVRSARAINQYLEEGCWKPEAIQEAWEQIAEVLYS